MCREDRWSRAYGIDYGAGPPLSTSFQNVFVYGKKSQGVCGIDFIEAPPGNEGG
jgi:hypothetical protein